jgi:hypothetical protein
MDSPTNTPALDLTAGFTERQLALCPFCGACGWRKGGINSWSGGACKCGHGARSYRDLLNPALM